MKKQPQPQDYTNQNYRLTFGKYKGQPINTVPADYLTWAIATVRDAEVKIRCRAELAWRSWYEKKAQQKTA